MCLCVVEDVTKKVFGCDFALDSRGVLGRGWAGLRALCALLVADYYVAHVEAAVGDSHVAVFAEDFDALA